MRMRTSRTQARWALVIALFIPFVILMTIGVSMLAMAEDTVHPSTGSGRTASVPREAAKHQRDLTRHARGVWGLDAPVALFAAQIHQESRWRVNAQSVVGAQGIAQFMPATASWISGAYKLGEPQPYNTGWALRALVTYDYHLWHQIAAISPCDRAAMTLSAYNGGLGWVYRDQDKTAKAGQDRTRWFGHVELFNAGRSPDNFAENRAYPRVILKQWQPIYALWGGGIPC